MRVRYTLPASAELDAVLETVSATSPGGARRLAARIKGVENLLERFPNAGAPTRLTWLRRIKVPIYPYIVFYEVTESTVLIHAVRHRARRPSTMPDHDPGGSNDGT